MMTRAVIALAGIHVGVILGIFFSGVFHTDSGEDCVDWRRKAWRTFEEMGI